MMNPLTQKARHNARRESIQNYIIAGIAGAILGAMLALSIQGNEMENINLLLDSARGQYIPRDFIQGFDLTKFSGISDWTIEQCQNPDSEFYWEAWENILNNAEYKHDDGRVFTLWQDGDLWLICYDNMTDEEKSNFGFDE